MPGFPGYGLNSAYYSNYGLGYVGQPQIGVGVVADTFHRQDIWHNLSNDFSIYQFPDAKNPQQFFKLGATLELLRGKFDTASLYDGSLIYQKGSASDYNVFGHAEYRNKTRNQKWDIEAFGKLYLEGVDVGDYNAYISLRRLISRQIGYFQGGFENVDRTPSFVFNRGSSFYYDTTRSTLNKENTTHIFASLDRPQNNLNLTASYYLISNYTYIANYYQVRQASTLFNLLEINVKKQFTLYRHWKWRTNTTLQQVAGSAPVHVPLLVSFNQVGYDGSFGFKNLFCSFGTEIRYVSGYKADGYSPLTGQFYSQGDSVVRQRLPDIAFYLHFRVRSFTSYLRVEGLNAIAFSPNGFGFYKNNFGWRRAILYSGDGAAVWLYLGVYQLVLGGRGFGGALAARKFAFCELCAQRPGRSAIRFVAGGVVQFDFEGGVLDVLMQQLVLNLMLELLDGLHRTVIVDDEMGSQGIFSSADGPDMDMMKILDVFYAGDGFPDLFDFDAGRDAIQGQAQTIPQQLPGAEEDDDGYGET